LLSGFLVGLGVGSGVGEGIGLMVVAGVGLGDLVGLGLDDGDATAGVGVGESEGRGEEEGEGRGEDKSGGEEGFDIEADSICGRVSFWLNSVAGGIRFLASFSLIRKTPITITSTLKRPIRSLSILLKGFSNIAVYIHVNNLKNLSC